MFDCLLNADVLAQAAAMRCAFHYLGGPSWQVFKRCWLPSACLPMPGSDCLVPRNKYFYSCISGSLGIKVSRVLMQVFHAQPAQAVPNQAGAGVGKGRMLCRNYLYICISASMYLG